jgi:hypothetical protein
MAGPAQRTRGGAPKSGAQDAQYVTVFGALDDYRKGQIDIIDDDPKNYVFSNVFEVASKAAAWERVVVGKNFEYVIETGRAEGTSPWFANAHDEFVLCMDGEIEVHLVKPARALLTKDAKGGHRLDDAPDGRKMGRLVLRRGHQGLLPAGCAYRFQASKPSVFTIQTILGPASIERWAEICLK